MADNHAMYAPNAGTKTRIMNVSAGQQGTTNTGTERGRVVSSIGFQRLLALRTRHILAVGAALVSGFLVAWSIDDQHVARSVATSSPGTYVRGHMAYVIHPPTVDCSAGEWEKDLLLELKNPWPTLLEIDRVITSCNCAVVGGGDKLVPAKGTLVIPLRAAIPPDGQLRRIQVEVQTKSGHRLLNLLSMVRYPIAAVHAGDRLTEESTTHILSFGEVPPRSVVTKSWSVTFHYDSQGAEWQVPSCEVRLAPNIGIQVKVGPVLRIAALHGGKVQRARAELIANLSEDRGDSGTVGMALMVRLPNGQQHQLPLTFVWNGRRPWCVEPPGLFVRLDSQSALDSRSNEYLEQLCHITRQDGGTFQVVAVRCDRDWLTGSTITPGDARIHTIRCRIRQAAIADWSRATLHVVVGPQEDAIDIPVTVHRAEVP